MSNTNRGVNAAIITGSAMFVFGLAVSAVFAAEWRVLHVLQALIYVAIVVLTRRRSPWGFGAGLATGLFWNSLSLFVTTTARDGFHEVASVAHTGHVQRPDLLLTLFAALGHVLIIIACTVGFLRLRPKAWEWWQLVGGGVLALAYLYAIVFAFGPPQAVDLLKRAIGLGTHT